MIIQVKQEINLIICGAISQALEATEFSLGEEIPEIIFSPTKNPEHGDLATPIAISLARALKMSPRKIAQIIVNRIDLEQIEFLEKIEIAGAGFINMFLSTRWRSDVLRSIVSRGENFGKSNIGNGAKVLVEFVSANPTGPLNIVSGRAASVGAAIVNLLNAIGYEAFSEFYVNDAGGQIERLGKSLEVRYRQELGESAEIPEDGYHGKYLKNLAKAIIAERSDDYMKIDETERLQKFKELAVKNLLEEQQSTLKRFGVEFDFWTSEKKIRSSRKPEKIINLFEKKGYLYRSENATWFKMRSFGDDKDCVLIKSNGEYTYFVPDAAYHLDKFNRGFELLIDLFGPDHQGHIAHLNNLIEALEFSPDRFEGLVIQQVNLIDEDGNRLDMSKRKGQIFTLDSLIDRLRKTVDERFAVDVARYFFLDRTKNSHLDFDIALAVSRANENPVFYIQYAHARCSSIFREMEKRQIEQLSPEKVQSDLLNSDHERSLINFLAEFPENVQRAGKDREPAHLSTYLYKLAGEFHAFYNRSSVLNAENSELVQARLLLVASVKTVLINGLSFLGISAPERM